MNFADKLFSMVSGSVSFIGSMFGKLFDFLAKPLSYLYYLLDAIFYFIYQLFNVVVKIIQIFIALLQFFGALVVGFVRTLGGMLTISFSKTPIHYPSESMKGIQTVINLVDPIGLLNVVPLIIIALTWFFFVKRVIGLLGGDIKADA